MFYPVISFLYKYLHIEYYNVIFLNIAFELVKLYSEIQIILKRVRQSYPINYFFQMFKNNKNKKLNILDSVKENEIMYRDSTELFLNTKTLDTIMDLNFRKKCDFFVYKDLDSTPINIKIIKNFQKLFTEETYNYKPSIKFILIEFIVNEKKYKIDLSKTENFYITDNVLDKNFFLYYLKHVHKDKIDLSDSKNEMKLKIIDDKVNLVEINFKEKNCIILGEKDYKII